MAFLKYIENERKPILCNRKEYEAYRNTLIRDVVEIRLHTSAEIERAKTNGFEIFYRDIQTPTNTAVRYYFICVSFADLMTLQGK